jgi:23S rRNA pseudouridine1911/1915/1917 synthase
MLGEITTFTGVLGAGRLDSALTAALPQFSRARIQALIADAALRINGQIFADAGSKKMSGQKFELNVPAPVPDKAMAQNIALDVVFEDEHLIIINKPAGLVVHPAAGHSDGTLVNALLHHCHGKLSGISGVQRPGIVHRLDKETSGVILVAKTNMAHARLAAQFEKHTIEKKYVAWVEGVVQFDEGVIELPLLF